jgi:preprotein translocase subunit SecF
MKILKYKNIFLAISGLLVVASLVAVLMYKLQLSIEFTGGSIIDFTTTEQIDEAALTARLNQNLGESFSLRTTENGYSLRLKDSGGDNEERARVLNAISNNNLNTITVQKYDIIGPTLGEELKNKALVALCAVIVTIALFIAYAFRHVSKPVSSWKYGLITMIALVHDVIITVGIFAVFGHFMGTEVDSLFLTALLVILGYSINDTIVVFDRIRENLLLVDEEKREDQFEEVIDKSLSQTFVRSLNTSLTTLLSIAIIWYFTSGSVENFALALFFGIASGTYSSIFVAAPLLTYFKPKEKQV